MKYIRISNLVQRANHLKKATTLLNKTNLGWYYRLNEPQSHLVPAGSSLVQSKRFASSGSHGGQSEMSKSALVYTLIGAGLCGVIIAFLSGDSKKETAKSARRVPVAAAEPQSDDAGAEEETQAEAEEPAPAKVEEKIVQKPAETKPAPAAAAPKKQESSSQQDKDKVLPEIPSHVQYLIVGGGTAALSAFKAIRASDATARILVVTEENFKPYMRPPLSKELWMTDDEKLTNDLRFKLYNGTERSLFFMEDEFYVPVKHLNEQENGGVAVLTGKRVVDVDIQNKSVRLDNNWEIGYDKCLIATGGKPKNLPVFEKSWESLQSKVTLFRNIEDYKRLYAIAKEGKTIAIVGGGFLGSELACALSNVSKKHGGKVIQIFPESGNLGRVLPQYLSQWTTRRITDEGVKVITEANIEKAQLNDQKVELGIAPVNKNDTSKAQWLLADHVVVAVGLEANVQLAKKSGFEIDPVYGGYVVNAELQARNSIWVAGDAASFYDIKLGRRRVEHHDHAVVSGRLAGENMTGANKPYWHQSMFWSDLGPKIGFEAIGLVDSSLQTVGLFAEADESDTPAAFVNENNEALRSEVASEKLPEVKQQGEPRKPLSTDQYGKGVVLYLKDETIVGVLLWNVFKRIPIARQLIQQQEKLRDHAEVAKLFRIDATGLEENDEEN